MSKALLVIDYTYDFVADDGRLTCGKPAQAIDEYITQLTKSFVADGDYVVFAVDVHDENDAFHPETKLFPPHNIRTTKGRDLYGALGRYFAQLAEKGLPDHVKWMDKTRYSSFAGTDLELFLRARGVNELHLVGVCTDICVLHTAVDAYNKGYRIVVHEKGVASFNPAGHEWALGHFEGALGATVIR
ncbi:cysteine hydrolase family protein [Alicyclobacillus pomorum]|jgi:nicotinamidase-related amidase|uniref:cysteine hydrolase family protein n=1 Tax=Alicyclobacillus pomorum TaxID=204470 RepID=UPI0004269336|nr:isochorismatase family cysteine hydrolase [Alicyclobacillus pomorum]